MSMPKPNALGEYSCHDCGSLTVKPVWWGAGPIARCSYCSAIWADKVQAKRKAEFEDKLARHKSHTYKRDLDGHCPDDGEICNECCEHEFDSSEGGYCLNCESHWSD